MKQYLQPLIFAMCLTASFTSLNGSAKTLLAQQRNSIISSMTTYAWQGFCTPFNLFWGVKGPSTLGLVKTGVSVAIIAALLKVRSHCKEKALSQHFKENNSNAAWFMEKLAVPLIDTSFFTAGVLGISKIFALTGLTNGTRQITNALLIGLAKFIVELYFNNSSMWNSINCQPTYPRTTFADLAGFERATRSGLISMLDRAPQKPMSPLEKLARSVVKDIEQSNNHYRTLLLFGAPGTGKTEFAKALAGTTHIPLLSLSIADIKKEGYGKTESNLELMFMRAEAAAVQNSQRNEPKRCILLLDELEMFGESRSLTTSQKTDVKLTAQLMLLLQFLEVYYPHVIVIGCTNHIEQIDAAIKSRFNLFGSMEFVELPSEEKRTKVIEQLLRKHRFQEAQSSSYSLNNAKSTAATFAQATAGRDIRFIAGVISAAAYQAQSNNEPFTAEILEHEFKHRLGILLLEQQAKEQNLRPQPSPLTMTLPTTMASSSSSSSILTSVLQSI